MVFQPFAWIEVLQKHYVFMVCEIEFFVSNNNQTFHILFIYNINVCIQLKESMTTNMMGTIQTP